MSRSNPKKKKRREAKTTVLVYCEGQGEEIFLKHLRSLFSYNSGKSITIKNGKGGTATSIVQNAIKHSAGYNTRVVILDNDKGKREMEKARSLAEKGGIDLIENTPCLEATLLHILEGKPFKSKKSSSCKKYFEKNYLSKQQRGELFRYNEVFPKVLLELKRKECETLDQVLHWFE